MDRGRNDVVYGRQEDIVRILNRLNETQAELACELKRTLTPPSNGCPVDFDTVLCWPQTPPNSAAVLPCFEQLNGIKYDTRENATRLCFSNGSWDQYSNYTSCKELSPLEGPEVELTTTIYFIGYTVSLVALLFAVYIFWKFKDLRCLRNTIHMNLMCSYILADFMWIFVYSLQTPLQANKAFCIFLIILLHYFHLTNFFWMFVEGLYLYILVVKTFTGENIKPRIYAVVGWGGPILFVLIWGIAKSFTLPLEDQQAGEMFRSCPWTPHPFDWIYQGPAIAVLIINVIFLGIIMWVLITKLRSANNVETQQYRKAAKALLVLIPLLGVTYILVIVGPTEGISRRIYDSLRAILLSTQGFTVALFYCFLNAEVKNTVRHHYNSWHTRRTLGSRRTRYSSSKDWSSQARDSMRLYQTNSYRKRGSTCSTGTTTTVVVVPFPKLSQQNKSASDSG
ncbi:diuretic hormone receptor-like [Tenebrio molitor]|uniref:diuretic hormone receptor-like n=1 Tax=Tenebrio molitor TaxID=7067 RepID=UPI0036249D18